MPEEVAGVLKVAVNLTVVVHSFVPVVMAVGPCKALCPGVTANAELASTVYTPGLVNSGTGSTATPVSSIINEYYRNLISTLITSVDVVNFSLVPRDVV